MAGESIFKYIKLISGYWRVNNTPNRLLSINSDGDVEVSDVSDLLIPEIYTIQDATVGNVRNDMPSYIELDNGNILCAFNHFGAAGSDIDTAYIAGKISSDGGKNWGALFTLQSNITGAVNTLVSSLYKNDSGKIIMLFLVSTEEVPTPESEIWKIVYNQDMTIFEAAEDIGLPTGYYSPACDRIFKDPANGNLLFPISTLVSGTGVSYESVYKGSMLLSEDDGETWTDLNLNIGSGKLLQGAGGGLEPGVYYTPEGLIYYFRTTLGATYGVYLDEDYNPVGIEFILFPSANAMSSIKWVSSLKMAVAGTTRLLDNQPIGDNERKYLDLLIAPDGVNFTKVDEIDHAVKDTDWYVNQPVIFEYGETVIVGYNNSKTGTKTASLFNKIYPKSFLNRYEYKPQILKGLSDNGRTGLINGVQVVNSNTLPRNIISLGRPVGGQFSSLSSSSTGAIEITLPNNKDSWVFIQGTVSEPVANKSFSFEISCYLSDLTQNTVKINGADDRVSLNVRFVGGTNPKIFIGELASTWSYPSVVINDVAAFYNNTLAELSEGWSIGLETSSFGTVVSTKSGQLKANIEGGNSFEGNQVIGGRVTVYDAPDGLSIILLRDDEGLAIGQRSGSVSGAIISDKTQTLIYAELHDDGKWSFGSLTAPVNAKYGFDGALNVASLPTYTDDSAAGSGGAVAGDIYKTASGELRIKL